MSVPSFLLVDAGNTRLKWATAGQRGSIRVAGEIATKEATSKKIRALARKFPKHRVVLASVVPKLIPHFRRAFAERLEIVTSKLPALGIKFDYPKPTELGADRLAAAVAAHAEGHYPAIIVACGTATALTLLNDKGRLCGGVIAPGLQAQLTALLGATAQLPTTTLQSPKCALAKSTQEAIRAGLILNFQGGVKEIVRRLVKELTGRPHIFLTGGNAAHLIHALDFPVTLRPLLVFEGLRIIGVRALK